MWEDGENYLVPRDLFISDNLPNEILFIGSCISQHISSALANSPKVSSKFRAGPRTIF